MNESQSEKVESIEQRLAMVKLALLPEGTLGRIAGSVVEAGPLVEAVEVGNVLLPPKQSDEAAKPRYQLINEAPQKLKETQGQQAEAIFQLAESLGMRKRESISEADLTRIAPDAAVWVIEGGANRTSVVRRQLALEAMQQIYGETAAERTMYQFGSDRAIPRERNGQPHPEFGVAQQIAGDFLPEEDTLTEYKLNIISALQAGYSIVGDESDRYENAEEVVVMERADTPRLVMVRPVRASGGLDDGFTAVREMVGDLTDRQLVIATNGQYRPKDELQAKQWATEQDIAMRPAVALGDEPGYEVQHSDTVIKTAERAPTAYVNEMVILHRIAK